MIAADKDALAMARKSAEAMWSADRATAALGMEIRAIARGEATLAMRVRETMANGHGICHGGYIFTLADSAFAYACNSYNVKTVAQHCTISFLAPGREGMVLVASAKERNRSERSGIYDAVVIDEATGTTIAEFRGWSRTIGGALYE